MSSLILIRGLPGSGKSTLAKCIPGYMHVEADHYFMADGEYRFDASRPKDAHEWCQWRVRDLLLRGHGVVVSNTFSRIWEMQPYIDMARQLHVPLQVIECKGSFGNAHGVPDATVEKMRERWEEYPVEGRKWNGKA